MSLRVSVCITTHNRREELARTLQEIARLDPPPDETLVLADGCNDGTAELIRERWPGVRLLEHGTPQGSIPGRNELARAASGDILLSLDDDSYPMGTEFIKWLKEAFAARPRVAVISFAQRTDEFPETLLADSLGPSGFVGSFANSAAAIHRGTFLELGGYPAFFGHMYEEPDFALRCVAAGWQVWHEASLVVRHHFTSAQRNEMRSHHRHSRNEFWSILLRCPFPYIFAVAGYRALRQGGYARKRGLNWLLREPKWWVHTLPGLVPCLHGRKAIPWKIYLSWMRLVRRPITDETDWEALFNPLR